MGMLGWVDEPWKLNSIQGYDDYVNEVRVQWVMHCTALHCTVQE
jgi:hypothetical protein